MMMDSGAEHKGFRGGEIRELCKAGLRSAVCTYLAFPILLVPARTATRDAAGPLVERTSSDRLRSRKEVTDSGT